MDDVEQHKEDVRAGRIGAERLVDLVVTLQRRLPSRRPSGYALQTAGRKHTGRPAAVQPPLLAARTNSITGLLVERAV
jgi:hypothetical protein